METLERLIVDLGRLDDDSHEDIVAQVDAAVLELDDGEYVRPSGALQVKLHCELFGEELMVRGRLAVPCRCVCGRCGGDFDAVFAEEEYCESFEITGLTFLDLTESVREGILLALPSYPICEEGCKGVCLQCGKNLNAGPCECDQAGEPSPWDALDGWVPKA